MSIGLTKRPDLPLYLQVVGIIRGQILDGEIRPGDQLPSEPELSVQYAVSRATIRQAFEQLAREGLISRHPGKGTFLTPAFPKTDPLARRPITFPELMVELKSRPQTLLRCASGPAPTIVGKSLKVEADEFMFAIRIVRQGKSTWGAVKHYAIPSLAEVLAECAEEPGLLPHVIGRSTRQRTSIAARWTDVILAEPRFAMMLKVPPGSPILSVWWVDRIGRRLGACSQLLLPGEKFSLLEACRDI